MKNKVRSSSVALEARFASLAQIGLQDVRFDVAPGADLDTAYEEVGALYAAVDAGRASLLDFKDSRR